MFAFIVAALIRIDYAGNVVTLENLVLFKSQETVSKNSKNSGCNLFSGRWIYDDVLYPLYKEGNCSFIGNEEFSCEKYGRENLKYQKWRWQPHHCDLPRFNGTALLEKLRDKNLVFVGDSINRNQWRSLLCLIEPYLPPSTNKTVVMEGNVFKLHVKDYNATIQFYWSPYLVESNADDLLKHYHRMVRIKSIEKHGRHWSDADILIFDTFAWWIPNLTILWGSFDSPDAVYEKVGLTFRSYEIALNTWSDWLEFHINRDKTRIFFMSHTPQRIGSMRGCHNVTEPKFDETNWQEVPKITMEIVESTIEKLEKRGVKVEYLNITQLSSYREDAHPSIHTVYWKHIRDPKFRDPNKKSNCLHWCLPGVPDVWNQFLYSYIMEP